MCNHGTYGTLINTYEPQHSSNRSISGERLLIINYQNYLPAKYIFRRKG